MRFFTKWSLCSTKTSVEKNDLLMYELVIESMKSNLLLLLVLNYFECKKKESESMINGQLNCFCSYRKKITIQSKVKQKKVLIQNLCFCHNATKKLNAFFHYWTHSERNSDWFCSEDPFKCFQLFFDICTKGEIRLDKWCSFKSNR